MIKKSITELKSNISGNKLTKFHLKNHITIVPGFMEKERLNQYIQSSDVIVFPFRIVPSEPPVSVFEAMIKEKQLFQQTSGV